MISSLGEEDATKSGTDYERRNSSTPGTSGHCERFSSRHRPYFLPKEMPISSLYGSRRIFSKI